MRMQQEPPLLAGHRQRLEEPDHDRLRSQRLLRDHSLMAAVSPTVAAALTPPHLHPPADSRHAAAVLIQRHVRGFLARRRLVGLLFAKFEEEERRRRERTMRQCREGELLVRNKQLWKAMDDDVTVRKNRQLRVKSAAITIQRAWRLRAAMSTSSASSLLSDHSELPAHVRAHFAAAGGRVVCREALRGPALPEETAEARARRLRKHSLLSLAVEFAQLKRVEREALPFDLHRLAAADSDEEPPVPMEEGSSDEEECELRPVAFSCLPDARSGSEERQEEEEQQQEEEEELRRAYRVERARVLQSLSMAGKEPLPSPRQEDRRPSRFAAASRITELTKPMQLCFINDASSDDDSNPSTLPRPRPVSPTPQGRTEGVESLLRRQSQLQAEAKLALAQAQPMARMQLEVEKDSFASPVMRHMVSQAGGEGRHLTAALLSALTVPHLHAMVADFQGQIEALNRRLMELLLQRDDLHMEQDSKLLDVEDLTRRAQEIAAKLQEKQQQSPARTQKEGTRSAASRAQAKARSTTRAVTSRLAAFFKSSNQSTTAAGASS